MKIHLPLELRRRLEAALGSAGDREIGGILMGEYMEEEQFRIRDITIQRRGGTVTSFVRTVAHAVRRLSSFFRATGHDYRRFNYLGEWHSHPLFPTSPSRLDTQTMRELVSDTEVSANFAILLIVRLAEDERLEASTTVFWPDGAAKPAVLMVED